MRDRDPNPGSRGKRPRAPLVLGAIAALEAVAIVLLVMTRTPEAERSPSARTPSPGAAQSVPAFAAPGTQPGQGAAIESAALPSAGPRLDDAPQPLAAARPDTQALGLVLCGTVAASDGLPLKSSTVAIDQAERDVLANVHQGTYSVAGLEPGIVTVSCSAPGCGTQTVQVGLDAARPIERQDFLLERLPFIPVRVRTPDGRALLEAVEEARLPGSLRVIATPQAVSLEQGDDISLAAGFVDLRRAQNWSHGEAELPAGDWDGVLNPQVPLPVFVNLMWGGQLLASEYVTTSGAGVTFTVELETMLRALCTVRARVVDADTALPVGGALAQLDSDFLQGDATGVFVFDRVKPGSHVLHIHPPGSWMGISDSLAIVGANDATYGDANVSLEVMAAQALDLGVLRLPRTVTVRGRLTDAGGRPLAVDVIACRLDPDAEPQSGSSRMVVRPNGNDGTFSVRVVPGRWSFSASNDPQAPGAKLLEIHGDVEGLNLTGVALPSK